MSGDTHASEVQRLTAELAQWREVTGCTTPGELAAELADLRARIAPVKRRGALMVALATAGAARVEAARAVDNAPTSGPVRAAACQRFNEADAAEKAARAALEALEATL